MLSISQKKNNNVIKLNDNIFHIKIIIYLEINLIQNKLLYNWANFEKEICNRLDAELINFKK